MSKLSPVEHNLLFKHICCDAYALHAQHLAYTVAAIHACVNN